MAAAGIGQNSLPLGTVAHYGDYAAKLVSPEEVSVELLTMLTAKAGYGIDHFESRGLTSAAIRASFDRSVAVVLACKGQDALGLIRLVGDTAFYG